MAGPLTSAEPVPELDEAQLVGVAEVMSAAGEPAAAPLKARLIAGGRSNLAFLLSDGVERWVLRTPRGTAGRPPRTTSRESTA